MPLAFLFGASCRACGRRGRQRRLGDVAHVTYFSRAWFKYVAARHGLVVAHWDASHEDGQAFELVLEKT